MKKPIDMFRGTVKAPFGTLTVVASDKGVRFCMFDNDAHPKSFEGLTIHDDANHPMVKEAVKQLREYLAGTRKKFDLKLDLQGTEFQVAAWRSLAKVPYGKTASYAQQAASIGRPKAVRAIGGANGRNPVAVILPCHRIIGADGSLTGFGGGLPVKVWLLEHEQKMSAQSA
jgi:methylated-DNA-[protein]-cysteine S-methyltransferase